MLHKVHNKEKHEPYQTGCTHLHTTLTYCIAVYYPDLDDVISATVENSQLVWGTSLPSFSFGPSQTHTNDLPKQRETRLVI
jgi:hypothetical protein